MIMPALIQMVIVTKSNAKLDAELVFTIRLGPSPPIDCVLTGQRGGHFPQVLQQMIKMRTSSPKWA